MGSPHGRVGTRQPTIAPNRGGTARRWGTRQWTAWQWVTRVGVRGVGHWCEFRGCNGGRARVGNSGGRASHRTGNAHVCQAAHRAGGAAARWGHRALPQRDRMAMGHMAMGRMATGQGDGARRRESGAPTGEHRALPRWDRMATGHGDAWRRGMRRGVCGRCSLWRRGCGVLHLIGGASFGRIKA